MASVHPNIDNRLPLVKLVHFNNTWKIVNRLIPPTLVELDMHTHIDNTQAMCIRGPFHTLTVCIQNDG